jgi:hypothetical protein
MRTPSTFVDSSSATVSELIDISLSEPTSNPYRNDLVNIKIPSGWTTKKIVCSNKRRCENVHYTAARRSEIGCYSSSTEKAAVQLLLIAIEDRRMEGYAML